jgi:hypothetical protein
MKNKGLILSAAIGAGIGTAIGVSIGTALGIALLGIMGIELDNRVTLWISFGMAVGAGVSIVHSIWRVRSAKE